MQPRICIELERRDGESRVFLKCASNDDANPRLHSWKWSIRDPRKQGSRFQIQHQTRYLVILRQENAYFRSKCLAMSRSNRIQWRFRYRGAARRSMVMPEPPNQTRSSSRKRLSRLEGVDMRDRFSFGREAFAAIRVGRNSRIRGEARYVDKGRIESTAGSLAPFGTRRGASQYECGRIAQDARTARDAGPRRGNGSEPRRRTSAQIRAHVARAVFGCVGFAVMIGSNERKGD